MSKPEITDRYDSDFQEATTKNKMESTFKITVERINGDKTDTIETIIVDDESLSVNERFWAFNSSLSILQHYLYKNHMKMTDEEFFRLTGKNPAINTFRAEGHKDHFE